MKSDAKAVEAAMNAIFTVIEEANAAHLPVFSGNRLKEPYVIDRAIAMFIVRQLTDLTMNPEEVTTNVVRAVFAGRDRSEIISVRNLQQRPYPGRDIHGVPDRWWKVVNAIDKRLLATVRIRAEYPEDKYDPFFNDDGEGLPRKG